MPKANPSRPNPKKTPKAVMAWGIIRKNGSLVGTAYSFKSDDDWLQIQYGDGARHVRVRITPVKRRKKKV